MSPCEHCALVNSSSSRPSPCDAVLGRRDLKNHVRTARPWRLTTLSLPRAISSFAPTVLHPADMHLCQAPTTPVRDRQVLERLKAVEATLAALRAQLSAPEPDQSTGPAAAVPGHPSAVSTAIAAPQAQHSDGTTARPAAAADAVDKGIAPLAAPNGRARTGWLGSLRDVFGGAAWQRQTSAGSNESKQASARPSVGAGTEHQQPP